MALGQYELYNVYLSETAPERKLYLAVGEGVYRKFILREAINFAVERLEISLIVVNIEAEEVVQWIR